MRPKEASTKLKKCKWCGELMGKPKTKSWPTYQNRKKFCNQSCGTKYQFRNGMSKEHRIAIGDGQIGHDRNRKVRGTGHLYDKKKKKYYYEVKRITNRQDLESLENYEKRGKARLSQDNADIYHLDHIIPISAGYEKGISPKVIGDISNLRMLKWKENIGRNRKQ